MTETPLFILIDGHALAYRHFHATKDAPLNTRDGEPTGATLGFTRTLLDIVLKQQPEYLAVSFDAGLSGRDVDYPAYKAHREATPEDLERQVARMHDVVRAFNIPILEIDGYEADDVIGTVARQAEAQGVMVRIVTGDKDILQLLTDNVQVYLQRTFGEDTLYTVEGFQNEYALQPPQLVDLKGFVGDTSDNIPGVPGVGQGTATPLLQMFGTLEGVYEHLDEVVPNRSLTRGRLAKLREHEADARLSKELARIRTDLPITLSLPACTTRDYDVQKVADIFNQLEFRSLVGRLNRAHATPSPDANATTQPDFAPPPAPAAGTQQIDMFADDALLDSDDDDVTDGEIDVAAGGFRYRADFAVLDAVDTATVIVRDPSALAQLAAALQAADRIAFDAETDSLDPIAANIVGLSFSTDGQTGYYVPVRHLDDVGEQLALDVVFDALRGPLTDPRIEKAAHNANFDLTLFQRHGLDITPITFDTMIAEWVRDTESKALGLKRLAQVPGLISPQGIQMQEISDLIGTGKKQVTFDAVPVALAAPYAAADAAITYRLVAPLRERLAADGAALSVFESLEMPLVPVISAMEQAGVLLDTDFLAQLSVQLDADLGRLAQEVYDLSGYGAFNINSPKQLNDVLFGKLGLSKQYGRKTVHGRSTAAAVLEELYTQTGNEVLRKVLDYRELSKLKGTYVDSLPLLINPRTGRLHARFNQTGTTTGRVSSSDPNLQNLPARSEVGRGVRRAVIAAPGHQLLSVDYSQVELRIMAHVSDEPFLKRAFAAGEDIHRATAAVVFGTPFDAVTYEQRNLAKRVNFGIMYGMGAFRLTRESNLTLAEAERFINTYFAQLPNVRVWLDGTKAQLYKLGYVETLFGRRRHFHGLSGMGRNDRNRVEREAINMPIQGTAADIMKRAMIDLHAEMRRRELPARLLVQVHDELLLEVADDAVDETAVLVVSVMESAFDLDPALRANAQVGPNWRDLQPVASAARA